LTASTGDERLNAHVRVHQLLLGFQVDAQRAAAEVGRLLPEVLSVFERGHDEPGLCRARRLQALVHWIQGHSAAAETAWQQAATHARHADDRRQLADILEWLASAALWGPTPAREGIRQCEQYLSELGGHLTGEAVILNHLAGLYAMQEEVAKAGTLLVRGRAILDDLGTTMTSVIAVQASFVAMLTGDAEKAEQRLRQDYEALRQMGETGYLATIAALLAQALAEQGRYGEAERFLRASRAVATPDDFSAQVVCQGVQARIFTARGQLPRAEEAARAAVARAEQTDWLNHHGDALLELARALAAAGHRSEARAVTAQALGLYERKGNLLAAKRVRLGLERATPS
jgi:tetratricopeptide (TPR) repeat protein